MMKRILVLTPRYPYPVIGGDRLRIYEVCKALSERYALHLLSLCDSKEELTSRPPQDGVFQQVDRVFLPRWRSYVSCVGAIASGVPLQVAYYRSKQFRQEVDRLAGQADLVLFHLVRLSDYVRSLDVPVVGELTDAISLNYARVRESAGRWSFRRLLYSFEQPRLRAWEQRTMNEVATSMFVSSVDAEFLLDGMPAGTRERVLVCSNGVNLEVKPFARPAASRTIIFIGNMVSMQNLVAARWFAEHVLPLLRRRSPDFLFRVIGRIRESDKQSLISYPGVEVTGEVSEVRAHCGDAAVGVCPVWLGAGVQNKILEYMSLGIPCITTRVGLEGLSALPGRDLLLADDAAGFSSEVWRICTDEALRGALSHQGRRYVEVHHSWDRQLLPAVERIGQLMQSQDLSLQA